MHYNGSCLCGAIRYEAHAAPVDTGYCHCRMCQLSSGSAALPWASFSLEQFRYTRGQPAIYRSSPRGQREFCGKCGSQLAFRATDRQITIEINIGTLEHPETVVPQYHIWCDSRIPWFDIDDELPRYPESGPGIGGS